MKILQNWFVGSYVRNIIWERRTSGTNTYLTKWVKKIKLNYCGIRNIQCDHVINATIDMIVAVNKQEKECAIVDIAVAGDKRIVENVKKYQELKGTLQGCGTRELCRWYRPIQIVVGSFASVTKNLEKWLESWTQEFVFHYPQKTTLLGTERILRKVLVSSRVRNRNLRVLFSWVMTRSLS